MNRTARIFVAGHRGLVGSAIVRRLRADRHANLLLRSRSELDLRDQAAVKHFFAEERPEFVFLAAGKVGGIHANNSYPADFIGDNLLIQANIIDAAYRHGTGKLLYRRQYGFNAIAVMPTNLYGPGDNFDLQNSHVLPALIRKFHEAKLRGDCDVVVWGSGTPRREFMHADDLAAACVFLMERYDSEQLVNVGWGEDVSIAELARLIGDIVGYSGRLRFDTSKPDGTPRKLLDTTRLRALGWAPKIQLREGIAATYQWLREQPLP
jgi:GDP-L-fucose synthase